MAVVVIDLGHHLLPNRLVYPVLAFGVALLVLASVIDGTPSYLWRAVVGGVLSFTGLGLLHLAQPQAIGFGDLRIGVIAGMFLAWLSLRLVLVGFALAFGTAALVAILLLVTGRRALRDRIAFAPFLVVGQFLAILVGSYGRHP
jgi:leader peptidase (prepilin peptidase)/N-methyltransferase